MPISGTIVEINESLEDAPEMVNESPYEEGWMIKIEIKDAAELNDLMDAIEILYLEEYVPRKEE